MSKPSIQESILDRLVDHEPDVSHEPAQFRRISVDTIKASIVRDLERLLNTRRQLMPGLSEYREICNSQTTYGLKDFTAENPKSPVVRQQLRKDIENAIAIFEPRLNKVSVRFEISESKTDSNLKFKISGLIVLENESEPVTFDSFLDVNRGEYFISN